VKETDEAIGRLRSNTGAEITGKTAS
jgi:hypothetical protein